MLGPCAAFLLPLAGPASGGRLVELVRPIVGTARQDVARGATLELRMGPRPNRGWGARLEDAPPSPWGDPLSPRSR